jgi:protein translocase SEC61 complex gamma subunit
LGLGSFLKSSSRLLRLARKPDRTELWLTIKICALGIVVIGMIGFVIKLLSAFLTSLFPT